MVLESLVKLFEVIALKRISPRIINKINRSHKKEIAYRGGILKHQKSEEANNYVLAFPTGEEFIFSSSGRKYATYFP